MELSFEVITDLQKDTDKLKTAWNSFDKDLIPDVFDLNNIIFWWQRYGHVNNERIGSNKKCLILLIYNNGNIKAILPLMTVQRVKLKAIKITSIEFICQSFNASVLDIIHNGISAEEVKQVFLFLKKSIKHDFISLSYLQEDSVLLKENTAKVFLHAGKVVIPLEKDYGTIKREVYSKNLRHILNKFNRRIRESGSTIKCEIVEGKDNIKNIKQSIIDVSLSKLVNDGKHSLYQNTEFGNKYFEEIINHEFPFCSVYFDADRLVSYNIGYIKDNIVYALDAAYNRNYADAQKIGLGILAYDKIVEQYAGKNKLLDMGFGLDDYKFRFSKKVEFTNTLLVKGNTIKSPAVYKRVNSKLAADDAGLKQILEKYLLTT